MICAMDKNKINHISRLLYEDLEKGLTFAQAKTNLMAKGYEDNEITHALYFLTFEKSKGDSATADEMKSLYEKDPELAEDIAKTLAEEEKNKIRENFFPYEFNDYGS